MSQSHVQRRRQQSVFRPRQTKNDVNTGALSHPPGVEADAAGTPDRELSDFMRRCAERDLI
jgi:hypothetical protein